MPDVKYFSKDGKEAKTVALSGPMFDSEPKMNVIQEYVRGYLNNQRQGTASTLNRMRMKGGGKKPFKQKGTGRARAGSNTSPVWTGGAIVFGPTPRQHYNRLPRTLKRNAMHSAFALRAKEGGLLVIEMPDMAQPKTKLLADYLKSLNIYGQKTILLYEGKNDNLLTASRNIRDFSVKHIDLVNPYDLLRHQNILITEQGLTRAKEIFGND